MKEKVKARELILLKMHYMRVCPECGENNHSHALSCSRSQENVDYEKFKIHYNEAIKLKKGDKK